MARTTADWKNLYDSNPEFERMYGNFEGFLEEIARRLARDLKAPGVENRLSPKHRAMAKALTEVA